MREHSTSTNTTAAAHTHTTTSTAHQVSRPPSHCYRNTPKCASGIPATLFAETRPRDRQVSVSLQVQLTAHPRLEDLHNVSLHSQQTRLSTLHSTNRPFLTPKTRPPPFQKTCVPTATYSEGLAIWYCRVLGVRQRSPHME